MIKQSNQLMVTNINIDTYKSIGATAEEVLANALNEAGLLTADTMINNVEASSLCNSFFSKRGNHKQSTQLGNLLVKYRIITLQQLKDALVEQKHNPSAKLGDILIEMKACTSFDIKRCIRSQDEIRKGMEEMENYQDRISNLRKKLSDHT